MAIIAADLEISGGAGGRQVCRLAPTVIYGMTGGHTGPAPSDGSAKAATGAA